jgi:hypothetical protein
MAKSRWLGIPSVNHVFALTLTNGNPKRFVDRMVVMGAYARPAVDTVAIISGYVALNRLRQPAEQAA